MTKLHDSGEHGLHSVVGFPWQGADVQMPKADAQRAKHAGITVVWWQLYAQAYSYRNEAMADQMEQRVVEIIPHLQA